jgi:hypothetical protein
MSTSIFIIPLNNMTYKLIRNLDPSDQSETYTVTNALTDENIGYIKLKKGHLTCSYPDMTGAVILAHQFDNNDKNKFNSISECFTYLGLCLEALNNYESIINRMHRVDKILIA